MKIEHKFPLKILPGTRNSSKVLSKIDRKYLLAIDRHSKFLFESADIRNKRTRARRKKKSSKGSPYGISSASALWFVRAQILILSAWKRHPRFPGTASTSCGRGFSRRQRGCWGMKQRRWKSETSNLVGRDHPTWLHRGCNGRTNLWNLNSVPDVLTAMQSSSGPRGRDKSRPPSFFVTSRDFIEYPRFNGNLSGKS